MPPLDDRGASSAILACTRMLTHLLPKYVFLRRTNYIRLLSYHKGILVISKISYWNHTWRYFMSQTRRRGNKSNTKIKKIYFGDLQNMSRKRIFVNLSFNIFWRRICVCNLKYKNGKLPRSSVCSCNIANQCFFFFFFLYF